MTFIKSGEKRLKLTRHYCTFSGIWAKITIIEQGPTPGDHMAAVGLARPLMKADCDGSFSISLQEGAMTVHGLSRCTLSTEDFQVQSVLGYTMPDDVRAAYDLMQTTCQPGATVEMSGTVGETRTVRHYPCNEPPVHLKIIGWAD